MLIPVGIVCLVLGVYFGYWCGYRDGLSDCIDDLTNYIAQTKWRGKMK